MILRLLSHILGHWYVLLLTLPFHHYVFLSIAAPCLIKSRQQVPASSIILQARDHSRLTQPERDSEAIDGSWCVLSVRTCVSSEESGSIVSTGYCCKAFRFTSRSSGSRRTLLVALSCDSSASTSSTCYYEATRHYLYQESTSNFGIYGSSTLESHDKVEDDILEPVASATRYVYCEAP